MSTEPSAALDQWYTKGLDVYNERIRPEKLSEFPVSHKDDIGLPDCESCVSIGPGPGDMDIALLESHFPRLKNYIAVDPNSQSLDICKERMTAMGRKEIAMEFVNTFVEDWEGPKDPVDLVLMIQSLYHVKNQRDVIKRSMSWLKPGGTLCIIHDQRGSLFTALAVEKFGSEVEKYRADEIRSDLEIMGLDYQEVAMKKTCDVRDRDRELLNFLCHKDLSQAEYEEVCKYLDEHRPSGVDEQISYAIWSKRATSI